MAMASTLSIVRVSVCTARPACKAQRLLLSLLLLLLLLLPLGTAVSVCVLGTCSLETESD